jgi:hypothetical protein
VSRVETPADRENRRQWAVENVESFESFGRAHEDESVGDDEIASFDQFDAHLLGEEGMLEVGRVVNPRREDRHLGFADPTGGEVFEGFEEHRGVFIDGDDGRLMENLWEGPLHHLAIFQNVRDTRRDAHVVFEDVELPVGIADKISPGDVAPDSFGRVQADALMAKRLPAVDDMLGDDAVLQDSAIVIDVVQEEIEGFDPLFQTAFDRGPFVAVNDAGDNVEGEDSLGAVLVPVNREGDPHLEKGFLGRRLPAKEFSFRERFNPLQQNAGGRPSRAGLGVGRTLLKHFIPEPVGLVSIESHGSVPSVEMGSTVGAIFAPSCRWKLGPRFNLR